MSGENPAFGAKLVPSLFTVYVTDNTPQAGTCVDCRGWSRIAAFIHIGDVTAAAAETITVKLQAGDASNGSDAADITGATTGALTVANALDNTIRVIYGNMNKVGKRYVRAVSTLSAVTTQMRISVVLALGIGKETPDSADYSQFVAF